MGNTAGNAYFMEFAGKVILVVEFRGLESKALGSNPGLPIYQVYVLW